MYGLISLGIFLVLLGRAHSEQECIAACIETQITEKSQAACKEGCRLQVIFAFASDSDDVISAKKDCYNGCAKSYNNNIEKQACSFGCDKQPDVKKSKIRISLTNKSPTFQVARGAMEKMMHRISNSFLSPREFGLASSEQRNEQPWKDPFTQFHFHIQNEMARLHQIAQNVFNLQHARTVMPVIATSRPHGHEKSAMEGLPVGNNDKNGEKIIEVKPIESKDKGQQLLGYESENPTVMEIPESSLISRLASRARRLSVLSQWLVCVALFLCLVSMLSIAVAILKQIKSQKYFNLRNMHAVVPPTFADSRAFKKVPLESIAVVTDYPLIHDSPPPAYDQLSIHKEKLGIDGDNFNP